MRIAGGRHPLPDINLLAQKFAQMGIVKLYPGGWSDWCSYLEDKRSALFF